MTLVAVGRKMKYMRLYEGFSAASSNCLTVTSSVGSLGQEYGSHTVQLVLASCSYICPI